MDGLDGTSTTQPPGKQPEAACEHLHFEAKAHVHRDVSKTWPFEVSFKVELQIFCKQCNQHFLFSELNPTTGIQDGCSPDRRAALLNIKPPS